MAGSPRPVLYPNRLVFGSFARILIKRGINTHPCALSSAMFARVVSYPEGVVQPDEVGVAPRHRHTGAVDLVMGSNANVNVRLYSRAAWKLGCWYCTSHVRGIRFFPCLFLGLIDCYIIRIRWCCNVQAEPRSKARTKQR